MLVWTDSRTRRDDIFSSMPLPLLLLAATQPSASTWQQGDVCTGTNATSPRFMLTGKHLIVGDEHWPPYSSIDRASGTWEGFDMDLIDAVANLLGFTYTIMEFNAQPPVAQTNDDGAILSKYNAYLHDLEDGALAADLLMSYWTINSERRSMKDLIMLSPHAEGATPVLAYIPTPVEALGRPTLPFSDAVKVATMPFTWRAWLTFFGIVVVSTVTLGLLEWRADVKKSTHNGASRPSQELKSCAGSISASFYLSTQLIAQAGGHRPKSRLGGMFMGFFALFIFVAVVIYGSSLTAALTAASVNKNSALGGHTVRSLIDQSRTVCIREADASYRRLRNKYASQGLTFRRVQSPISAADGVTTIDGATELLRRMRMPRDASETCHAAVVTQGIYDKWTASGVSEERQGYANVIAAHFGLDGSVNASLAQSQCGELDTVDAFDTGRGKTASWVTTSRGLCVGRAFDWAISNLVMEGTLAEIEARWFPRAHACASSTNLTSSWTNNRLSVDVDELAGIIIFWLIGLVLTVVGWLLPGSHELIEQGGKRARASLTSTPQKSVADALSAAPATNEDSQRPAAAPPAPSDAEAPAEEDEV